MGMAKASKSDDQTAVEGDAERGDEILKRMLQTKPKQHKDMVKESKAKRGSAKKGKSA
jgi:hypothetical protein